MGLSTPRLCMQGLYTAGAAAGAGVQTGGDNERDGSGRAQIPGGMYSETTGNEHAMQRMFLHHSGIPGEGHLL